MGYVGISDTKIFLFLSFLLIEVCFSGLCLLTGGVVHEKGLLPQDRKLENTMIYCIFLACIASDNYIFCLIFECGVKNCSAWCPLQRLSGMCKVVWTSYRI